MVVEMAGSQVPWTAPVDLTRDDVEMGVNHKSQPRISSKHPRCAIVVLADGSARAIIDTTPPHGLDAALSIDGGDDPGDL